MRFHELLHLNHNMNFHFTGDLKKWSDRRSIDSFLPHLHLLPLPHPIWYSSPFFSHPHKWDYFNRLSTSHCSMQTFLSSVMLLHSCLTHLLILSLFSGSFLSYYSSKAYICPCQQCHALNLREIIAEYFKDLLGQAFTDHPLSPPLSSLCLHPPRSGVSPSGLDFLLGLEQLPWHVHVPVWFFGGFFRVFFLHF